MGNMSVIGIPAIKNFLFTIASPAHFLSVKASTSDLLTVTNPFTMTRAGGDTMKPVPP